ncbi:MAG: nucleotidyltransferase family protein [Chloroflexi bacterium]|nr:nucleotidyltransferase family protein [Chloroflexota bacterium]
MSVAAIVLAAGASRRMGRPKPLLDWGDRPLIVWELEQLLSSCVAEIVIVTGSTADDVRRALGVAGARYCVFNPRWPQGRATSLALGVRTLLARDRSLEAVVLQSVDQPTRADIIDRLVDELRRAHVPAVQPGHVGRGGHPVVVSAELLPDLADAREATLGLRGVLERHPPHRLPMDDEPIVRVDMNTLEQLAAARRLLGVGDGRAAG